MESTLRVAAAIANPDLAAAVLQPFTLERLTPKAAPLCGQLLERYGIAWCRRVFTDWAAHDAHAERKAWLAALPSFCGPLGADDSRELARWLVSQQWDWLAGSYAQARDHASPNVVADELLSLSKPMLGLLASSVMANDPRLRQAILGFMTSGERDDLVPCLVDLLRIAHSTRTRDALTGMGLGAVHERCVRALEARRDAPIRAKGPRYMIRDRDGIYGAQFRHRVQGLGIKEVLTAPRSPWQNPFAERLVGSVRRECPDHDPGCPGVGARPAASPVSHCVQPRGRCVGSLLRRRRPPS